MSKLTYKKVISVKYLLLNSHILHYAYGGLDQLCIVAPTHNYLCVSPNDNTRLERLRLQPLNGFCK